MASKKVVMYTDGACSGNPGNGGWGAYIEIDDKKIELSGSENNTTNNRMELKAVINALDYLNEKRDIIIFTDSNSDIIWSEPSHRQEIDTTEPDNLTSQTQNYMFIYESFIQNTISQITQINKNKLLNFTVSYVHK